MKIKFNISYDKDKEEYSSNEEIENSENNLGDNLIIHLLQKNKNQNIKVSNMKN